MSEENVASTLTFLASASVNPILILYRSRSVQIVHYTRHYVNGSVIQ